MFKKVLVPLDGSESAERVARWTIEFAGAVGAEVSLLAVIDPDELDLPDVAPNRDAVGPTGRPEQDLPGGHDTVGRVVGSPVTGAVRQVWTPVGEADRPPGYGTQVISQAQEQARVYLQRAAKQMEKPGVRLTTSVQVGDPAEVIVEQASELGADMISMATHRGSALARGILGSVADRVLHSSPVPVLVAHPQESVALRRGGGIPRTVIAPVDGSERSAMGVATALDIAESCGSEVVFLQAVKASYGATGGVGFSSAGGDFGISGRRQEISEELQKHAERARERGVAPHVRVPVGNAAGQIVQAAEDLDNPLIVMTTRGTSGIRRWVMGSVTDKVIRSSGSPVLVLQSPES